MFIDTSSSPRSGSTEDAVAVANPPVFSTRPSRTPTSAPVWSMVSNARDSDRAPDERSIEPEPDRRVRVAGRGASVHMLCECRECVLRIEIVGVHDHYRAVHRGPCREHGVGGSAWFPPGRPPPRSGGPGRASASRCARTPAFDPRRIHHDDGPGDLPGGRRYVLHQHVGDRGAVGAHRHQLLLRHASACPARQPALRGSVRAVWTPTTSTPRSASIAAGAYGVAKSRSVQAYAVERRYAAA